MPVQLRFTLRDAFWFTVVAALAVAWWADRSVIAWRHQQLRKATNDMVARLDEVDPGWQNRTPSAQPHFVLAEWRPWQASGYGIGATLIVIAVVLVILIWRGNIHPSVLDDRPRM